MDNATRRGVISGLGLAAVAAGLGLREMVRQSRSVTLRGRVVLITGGSRGLGLALARRFAAEGARVAICARDAGELERARAELAAGGAEVIAPTCDVTDEAAVNGMVERVVAEWGAVDVLVNNAGIITVGPLDTQRLEDFRRAMDVMYWGVVHTTLAVLPHMRRRRFGRVANITSIGGRISVPHLLPYSAAKFAAAGLSAGLRAELAREGILVTTVVPGLMRTGSHVNASFKGNHRAEYAWFSLGAASPLTAISASRAAARIVDAVRHGDAQVTLGLRAAAAERVHGLFPGAVANLLAAVNRLLPSGGGNAEVHTGAESASAVSESPFTAPGRRAGVELNQTPAPETHDV